MHDVLGYARVSTGDQDLSDQLLRLKALGPRRMAARQLGLGPATVYRETALAGVSGAA